MIGTAVLLPALVTALALPAPRPEPHFDLGLAEAYGAIVLAATPIQPTVPRVPDFAISPERPLASFDEPGYGRRIALDVVALGKAPFQMDRRAWKRFGLGLALVGAAALFDGSERSDAVRDDSRLGASEAIRPLGQEAGFALLGAAWIAGRSLDRPVLVAVAKDGLEASILSALVVAPLKEIVGRTRPRDTDNPQDISPFSGELSFPSGEAAQIFALAAVVAAHTDRRWVKFAAYGVASLVGFSRIELDGHWASDVVAGALIGHAIGRWVVKRHGGGAGQEDRVQWRVTPTYDRDRQAWGLGGAVSF